MKYQIFLIAMSALALSTPLRAEVYKCRTADGRVEIANTPCPSGASTMKTVREEQISEASRQQAEREVERMRDQVEKREAAQRSEESSERERQRSQPQSYSGEGNSGRSVEDCLRDLDRQALQPAQRSQMDAACRNNPQSQPVYVPVPVPVYGGGASGNPLETCIQGVERLTLMPAERSRRISQCETSYGMPSRPPIKPASTVTKPAAAPAPSTTCLPGSGCGRR